MVLDALAHADAYFGLGPRIAAALEFLSRPDTGALEPAAHGAANSLRIDIQGDDVFALVQRYHTKSPAEAFWECHRKYIDVQCVIEGSEMMRYAPLEAMKIIKPYDEAKDFTVVQPCYASLAVHEIRVEAGMFAIFMPQDAHMPGLHANGVSSLVKKIVVKVRAD